MTADEELPGRLRDAAELFATTDRPWWWDAPEIGGPEQLLNEAASHIEHLEAIVRDLAAADPAHNYSNQEIPAYECLFCEAHDGNPDIQDSNIPIDHHTNDCPWRRAVELQEDP